MTTQSEAILEEQLIKRLCGLGYQQATLSDAAALPEFFREQLGRYNKTSFTDEEFKKIMIHLDRKIKKIDRELSAVKTFKKGLLLNMFV